MELQEEESNFAHVMISIHGNYSLNELASEVRDDAVLLVVYQDRQTYKVKSIKISHIYKMKNIINVYNS